MSSDLALALIERALSIQSFDLGSETPLFKVYSKVFELNSNIQSIPRSCRFCIRKPQHTRGSFTLRF